MFALQVQFTCELILVGQKCSPPIASFIDYELKGLFVKMMWIEVVNKLEYNLLLFKLPVVTFMLPSLLL